MNEIRCKRCYKGLTVVEQRVIKRRKEARQILDCTNDNCGASRSYKIEERPRTFRIIRTLNGNQKSFYKKDEEGYPDRSYPLMYIQNRFSTADGSTKKLTLMIDYHHARYFQGWFPRWLIDNGDDYYYKGVDKKYNLRSVDSCGNCYHAQWETETEVSGCDKDIIYNGNGQICDLHDGDRGTKDER